LQWLQNPSEINGNNLENVRHETSRRKYLKDRISELPENNKNKNTRDLYRGINEFQRGYQPRSNVHRVSDVRQIEICTAAPLVPDCSPFEDEIAVAKMKKYELPGSDEILAELIQAGGEILRSKIHKLINSI
jgi:hypothetical protein